MSIRRATAPAAGSTIVDPWGIRSRPPRTSECAIVAELDFTLLADVRERLPALTHRRDPRSSTSAGRRRPSMSTAAVDKRRVILDAAVRVFARQGFHTCRVSDIADEAGVAYGLVYHYFPSKETILDTLFLENWDVMLAAIAEAEASTRRRARSCARSPRSSSTPTAMTLT